MPTWKLIGYTQQKKTVLALEIVFVFLSRCFRMTFIADERFQAYFKEESKQWVLQIKYVQPRDVGLYECQVSTEPKVSARAYLHVVGKCENNKPFNYNDRMSPSHFVFNTCFAFGVRVLLCGCIYAIALYSSATNRTHRRFRSICENGQHRSFAVLHFWCYWTTHVHYVVSWRPTNTCRQQTWLQNALDQIEHSKEQQRCRQIWAQRLGAAATLWR